MTPNPADDRLNAREEAIVDREALRLLAPFDAILAAFQLGADSLEELGDALHLTDHAVAERLQDLTPAQWRQIYSYMESNQRQFDGRDRPYWSRRLKRSKPLTRRTPLRPNLAKEN